MQQREIGFVRIIKWDEIPKKGWSQKQERTDTMHASLGHVGTVPSRRGSNSVFQKAKFAASS